MGILSIVISDEAIHRPNFTGYHIFPTEDKLKKSKQFLSSDNLQKKTDIHLNSEKPKSSKNTAKKTNMSLLKNETSFPVNMLIDEWCIMGGRYAMKCLLTCCFE